MSQAHNTPQPEHPDAVADPPSIRAGTTALADDAAAAATDADATDVSTRHEAIGRASRKIPRPLTTRHINSATCDPDILEAAIAVSEQIRDPLSIRAGDQRDIYDQDGNHLSTLVIHSMRSVITSSVVTSRIRETLGVESQTEEGVYDTEESTSESEQSGSDTEEGVYATEESTSESEQSGSDTEEGVYETEGEKEKCDSTSPLTGASTEGGGP
eukprot:UC1_evm1s1822